MHHTPKSKILLLIFSVPYKTFWVISLLEFLQMSKCKIVVYAYCKTHINLKQVETINFQTT